MSDPDQHVSRLTVRVNNTRPDGLPDWGVRFLRPELQARRDNGEQYNLNVGKLNPFMFLENDHVNEMTNANIWRVLIEADQLIGGCLNFRELVAIQEDGTDFFSRHFSKKCVLAWRSVCQRKSRSGCYYVPFLYEASLAVVIGWRSFGQKYRKGKDLTLMSD